MSRATDELRERKASDEADTLLRLAALAALLLFLSFEQTRTLLAFRLARHFAPVIPAGLSLVSARSNLLRARARDRLQDFFSNHVRALAFELEASGDVRAWRAAMSRAIVLSVVGQKTLAVGRRLLPSETLDLIAPLDFELSHVDDFAEEIESKAGTPQALSAKAVGARSELYSGSGRAVWFKADERGKASGVVFYYEAVDDKGTCSPCLDAESRSPYLPGEGAMPGQVCKGRGRCRCIRIPKDAPKEFERLMNRKTQLQKAVQI